MGTRSTNGLWTNWWNLFLVFITVLQIDVSSGELRLGGGPTPREGRLEVAYENNIQPGHWAAVCGDGWTNENAIVACNEAGFPGPAVAVRHAKEIYGESYLNIMLTNVVCDPEVPSLVDCRNTTADSRPCATGREAGAICQKPGYQGCFKMAEVTIQSDAFMISKNMTLDTCLAYCMNRSIQYSGIAVDHCHCWNYMPNTTSEIVAVAPHHCLEHCPANPLQVCGGSKGVLKTFVIYDTYVGFCTDPGDIMNGYKESEWFQYGSTVSYQCDEGYEIQGDQNLTCVESGFGYDWNDVSPVCNRIIVTTEPPTFQTESGGVDLTGEQKLEVLYVGVVGGGVAILLLIVTVAIFIACCKSRRKRVKKKKPKKLIDEDDEESQVGKTRKKKWKKSKTKVKKKNKEQDVDEKDKDELELDFDTDDDIVKEDELEQDNEYDEEEATSIENKANAKLDQGPIATADLSYYQTEVDQSGKNKNKPLPSARGQGRPTSSSKPAKFNFIETDERKNSKRSRGGMMKNVMFVKGNGDDASDILLKDP